MNSARYTDLESRSSGTRSTRDHLLASVAATLIIGLVSCTSTKLKTPDQLADAQALLVLPVHETNEAHLKKHGFYYIYEIVNIDSLDITHRAEFKLLIKEGMLIVDSLPPGNYAVRQFEFKTIGTGNFTYGNNIEERHDRFSLEAGKITIFHQSLDVRLYNKIPGRGMTTHYQFGMNPLAPFQRNAIVRRLEALQYLHQWEISDAVYPTTTLSKKVDPLPPGSELTGTYVSENTEDKDSFFSNYPGETVELVQSGHRITGSIGDTGKISGRIEGKIIDVDWWDMPGGQTGVGEWTYDADSAALKGSWATSTRNRSGTWNLRKVASPTAAGSGPNPPVTNLTGTYLSENTGTNRNIFLSNYSGGKVSLIQEGSEINGTYGSSGKIAGEMKGSVIRFDWWGIPRHGSGVGIWEVIDGGSELRGTWTNHGRHYNGTWNLKKID